VSEQDNKLNKMKDHLTKLESESGQYNNRVKEFQQDLKKQATSVSQSIDQGKTDILTEISKLATTVSDLTDSLNRLKSDIDSEKKTFGSRLGKLLEQLQKGTATLQNQLNTVISTQEQEISQIYSQMAGKVNTGLSEIYSHQYKQIKGFQDQISNKLAHIQKEFISTVERESTNIGEMSDNVAASFVQSLDVLARLIANTIWLRRVSSGLILFHAFWACPLSFLLG